MSAELGLAKRLHTLSSDYDNQPLVARRGIIGSLMKFMQSTSTEVRITAADTVRLLSSHPENPEYLVRERGLVPLLFQCFQDSEAENQELHGIYAAIFENLRPALGMDKEGEEGGNEGGDMMDKLESVRTVKRRTARTKHSTAFKSRRLVIGFEADEEATKEDIDEVLQTTRGVVSYTVDMDTHTMQLYLSTATEAVVKLLEDAGFKCDVQFEGPMESRPTSAAHGDGPGYLDDAKQSEYKRSLVLHGMDGNSLASRIEKRKQEQQRKKMQAERGHIASFISKLTSSWW
jgi:hypothetical protein